LRIGKDGAVVGTGLHAREDVVAGAVDDAGDAFDLVATETLGDAGDNGHAAGDGCAVDQLYTVGFGERKERWAAIGDELLICGDDGFLLLQGFAEPAFRR